MSHLIASSSRALSGEVRISGDKSISHRALIVAALCLGKTEISGLLESEDVLATLDILRALGVRILRAGTKEEPLWHVFGAGAGAL